MIGLCNRALKLPHLLCYISIDEVDSLVPKRFTYLNIKISETQNNLVLKLIFYLYYYLLLVYRILFKLKKGIKDVPNLIFLTSTNRINEIDEAFRRRLSG